MPYIIPAEREQLDELTDALTTRIKTLPTSHSVDRAGRLNYVCTRLALGLFPMRRYWVMALVCGVFINVILEYYRRWVAPYEDDKIKENGDVYPYEP